MTQRIPNIELPPPEPSYNPLSDETLVRAIVTGAGRAARKGSATVGLIAAIVGSCAGVLGMRVVGPASDIEQEVRARVEGDSALARVTARNSSRLDNLERRGDSTLSEIRDVKTILCAMAQPTGRAAAEKCLASSRRNQ